MMTHTPGPWHIGEKRRDEIDIKHANKDTPGAISLVLAKAIARQSWTDEGEANARLIAAAPDLLAALEQLIELCAVGDVDESTEALGWGATILSAKAAIARAKGQE
jgi:hypothetical protein